MKKIATNILTKVSRILSIEQTDRECQYCGKPVYESDDYVCDKEVCQLKREIHTSHRLIKKLESKLSRPNISMASIMQSIRQYLDWNGTDPKHIYISPDLHAEIMKEDLCQHIQYRDGKNPLMFGMEILPATTKVVGWYIE